MICALPVTFEERDFKEPGYKNTHLTTKLLMHGETHLLTIMQGPSAVSISVKAWAQYVRRICAYASMVFGTTPVRVVTDQQSTEYDDEEWIRLYSHICRTTGLAKTGAYLTTESMMVMMDLHKSGYAGHGSVDAAKKDVSCPLGCMSIKDPLIPKKADELAGLFREGTMVLITNMNQYIATSTGWDSTGADLGWDSTVYQRSQRSLRMLTALEGEICGNVTVVLFGEAPLRRRYLARWHCASFNGIHKNCTLEKAMSTS